MNFAVMLIPISAVSVSISFGGGMVPIALIIPMLVLPFFGLFRRRSLGLSMVLILLSVGLRYTSLFSLAEISLGKSGALLLVAVCIATTLFSVTKNDGAIYSALPTFILTVLLAVFVAMKSDATYLTISPIGITEAVASLICPLGICIAFSIISDTASTVMLKYLVIGVAVATVFVIFPNADTEFALLAVPVTVITSAIEFYAIKAVIFESSVE